MTSILLRGWLAAALVPLALLCAASPAAATPSLDACSRIVTPDAVTGAVVIDTPGTWCLDRDHAPVLTSANKRFIQVNSDDVTLDCRGHRVTFAGTYSEPWAISANGRQRIVVRNCIIRGFWLGIELDAATLDQGDFLVEDNLFIGGGRSIAINGTRSMVRRNRILDSIHEVPMTVSNGVVDVVDNVIDGVVDAPFVLWMNAFDGGEIRGNTIRNIPAGGFGQLTEALYISQSAIGTHAAVWIHDNVLVGTTETQGILCDSASTRFSGNLINGFTVASSTCTDAGENDITP